MENALPTIAASDYLNSAVLMHDFLSGAQRARCQLITDAAPSRCAALLRQGEVAAALIPAIEYQRIPGLCLVEGVAIGSKRAVRSVVLALKKPLKEVQTVALDTSSRSSASLAQILFAEFYQQAATFHPAEPDARRMLAEHDAAVIIGDPALTFDRRGLEVLDLAAEWRRFTDLPFVFAVWAVRAEARERVQSLDFVAARDAGLRARPDLAAQYAPALGLPEDDLADYLMKNIHYGLDAEDIAGLTRYWALAAKRGLIPEARPIRWL
ncbi:MAG: hypothetical protein CFK52_10935 [Chloracidobacterium sp. CP2_5A]|nr:MAG: hypothetical protein CFK52_10935 [Chloracidobacterium sp. CP2_5A]